MAIVVASPFPGWLPVPCCNWCMGGWRTEEKRVPNMSIKSTGRRTQVLATTAPWNLHVLVLLDFIGV